MRTLKTHRHSLAPDTHASFGAFDIRNISNCKYNDFSENFHHLRLTIPKIGNEAGIAIFLSAQRMDANNLHNALNYN